MFKKLKIVDESNKVLRKISKEVEFPLSKTDSDLIQQIIDNLTYSQIDRYAKKYNLRPGMGLAFPQINLSKRIIVIVYEVDEQVFDNYVFINPKIVSHSNEIIAVDAGEGCLSVNRDVEGHVKRYARVTVEGYDEEGNKIKVRAREELAIAFQHEIDHLNGIMFYDKINKKHPFITDGSVRLL